MKNREPSFTDRLGESAKARQTQLEKARASRPADDPGFAERQEARRAADLVRQARVAERKAVRKAEKAAKAAKKAAEEAARVAARDAQRQAREKEIAEEAAREVERLAKAKAARDLRYAARKARR